MFHGNYWSLVDEGPEEFTHDQRVLFWWLIGLLPTLTARGTILAPSRAPLTTAEIIEVYNRVRPLENGTRSEQNQTWAYQEQTFIVESSEGLSVQMRAGRISAELPPLEDEEESVKRRFEKKQ